MFQRVQVDEIDRRNRKQDFCESLKQISPFHIVSNLAKFSFSTVRSFHIGKLSFILHKHGCVSLYATKLSDFNFLKLKLNAVS